VVGLLILCGTLVLLFGTTVLHDDRLLTRQFWRRTVTKEGSPINSNGCKNPTKQLEGLSDAMNPNRKPVMKADGDQDVDPKDGCLMFKDAPEDAFDWGTAERNMLDCTGNPKGNVIKSTSAIGSAITNPSSMSESTALENLFHHGGCDSAKTYMDDFLKVVKFGISEMSEEGKAARLARRARGVSFATDVHDGFCAVTQSQTAPD
jgi:hypothetical protein